MSKSEINPSREGWGPITAILILAVVTNLIVYKIHKATYLAPDKPAAAAPSH